MGIFIQVPGLDDFVTEVGAVAERGFASAWTPQIFGFDALTALALAGREVPGIELGTAVVPTYPRHPMALAAQALTTQAACHGRLTLGIGLSHQVVIESMFGYSFDHPARHMKEYLSALLPLLREGKVAFEGETVKAMGQLDIPGADPVPVLVAALGPVMLGLAGGLAEGTATWMTGPKTLGAHIVPTITAAAEAAGRPAPRVTAALPVSVTDDPAAARQKAAAVFAVYDQLPSYKAMLDREGAGGPADVAIVGDESTVRREVEALGELGVTEFVAVPFHERSRTVDVLATLLP
ncbi:MAG: TIGR03564 family F420-dependent LLM class oxidoreductase [Actinomycetota bacterium]|nr:TIGR03564 family F420-dependent LLM class oxidoreductase [Actinomycetota bacterium]